MVTIHDPGISLVPPCMIFLTQLLDPETDIRIAQRHESLRIAVEGSASFFGYPLKSDPGTKLQIREICKLRTLEAFKAALHLIFIQYRILKFPNSNLCFIRDDNEGGHLRKA
jgi:hypothetical protein